MKSEGLHHFTEVFVFARYIQSSLLLVCLLPLSNCNLYFLIFYYDSNNKSITKQWLLSINEMQMSGHVFWSTFKIKFDSWKKDLLL